MCVCWMWMWIDNRIGKRKAGTMEGRDGGKKNCSDNNKMGMVLISALKNKPPHCASHSTDRLPWPGQEDVVRAAIRQGQGCYFVCCPLRCCPSLSLGQCLGHLRSVSIKGPLLPQRTDATKKTPLAPHYEKKVSHLLSPYWSCSCSCMFPFTLPCGWKAACLLAIQC